MPAPSDAPKDPRAPSRLDLAIGAGLGLATFLGLLLTEKGIGVPRDESFYFSAGGSYAAWFKLLLAHPGDALTDDAIRRFFSNNSEHPGLMKELFGISHAILFEWLHACREIAAYRMPTFVLAGVFALALYLLAAGTRGRAVGVFAVAAFFLSPRNWFHAHLACFDFPICAMWLFTIYAYWRSETGKRWQWLTGVALGLALATKHNAFFLPPVLALHWIVVRGAWILRKQGAAAFVKAIPNTFWWMAGLGPAVLYLVWPYLWFHPFERVGAWIGFHLNHVHYAWLYFGDLMREPPFPLEYPWVVTAMTVPIAIVVAMNTGLLSTTWTALRALPAAWRAKADGVDADAWLLLINSVASIAIIMPPTVPHFGGEKHWMASMPFLGILAGVALSRGAKLVATRLPIPRASEAMHAALFALVLAPALIGVIHTDGYGTGFYNALVGGQPGAAALQMQRQFWSNNVTGVLPWLNENAPEHARVFFHEVTSDSVRAYQANGMLRPDIQSSTLEQADIACYQYHQEFRFWEYAIWTNMHTRWPSAGLYLDEVPNIECYERDRTY